MRREQLDEVLHPGLIALPLGLRAPHNGGPRSKHARLGDANGGQLPGLDRRVHRPARNDADTEAGLDELDDGFRQRHL